jgi:hypothetical protein
MALALHLWPSEGDCVHRRERAAYVHPRPAGGCYRRLLVHGAHVILPERLKRDLPGSEATSGHGHLQSPHCSEAVAQLYGSRTWASMGRPRQPQAAVLPAL